MPASKKPSRTLEMIQLPAGFVPGPSHVICAKGKQAKQHPANRLLKCLVQSHLDEYDECPSKLERSFLVSKLIRLIRQEGGFVRNIAGKWCDVGDRNAREKIGQAFRDSLHTKYKSSTKAKASMRRRRTSTCSNGSVSSLSDTDSCSMTALPALAVFFPMREVTLDNNVGYITPDVPHKYIAKPPKNLSIVPDIEPLPLRESLSHSYASEPQRSISCVEDFEPIPLNQALVRNQYHSMSLVTKDNDSFEKAMDEMFQSHLTGSSEDAIAFAFSSLGSLPSNFI